MSQPQDGSTGLSDEDQPDLTIDWLDTGAWTGAFLTGKGTMMAPEGDDPLREIRQRERDGERVLVEIGPFTAVVLIGALQAAHQFPLFSGTAASCTGR